MTDDLTFDFFNHLFGGVGGFFEITLIHPQRAKGKNILTRFYELGVDVPDWDRIEELNADGWGCYYGTTVTARKPDYGRRREVDVSTISCLWCEIDYQDGVYNTVDDVLDVIGDYAPPTVFIASGGGVHALWRIAPVAVTPDNRATIKQTLRGMAVEMRADTSATDLARILRMPGSVNTKPARNGARCEIIDLLPGEYTFDTFAHYRDYAQPVSRPIERDLPVIADGETGAQLVEWYATNGDVPHQRNSLLNWTAHQLYSNGVSETKAAAWLMPIWLSFGKSEKEGLATIRSAYTGKRSAPAYLSRRSLSRIRAGEAGDRKII